MKNEVVIFHTIARSSSPIRHTNYHWSLTRSKQTFPAATGGFPTSLAIKLSDNLSPPR